MALTLKQRTNRLRLPNLVSVVNCPTIKANGELIAEPGFDPDIGILFDPRGVKFPPVPLKPGKAMAMTALARIMRLIKTFDFVSDDDKAVALSLILTAIARPGMPTAPLHGFDAPVAGSGKSKLVDIASILATGHEAGVTAQGETREEAEKRFSTLLMRGDLIIALDNCEGPLEGVVFNQALTQQWANLRILGQSKADQGALRGVDHRHRQQSHHQGRSHPPLGRVQAGPEGRAARTEAIRLRPIADAKDNRGELVAAVLAILRAYHVAGRPNRPPRLQSFEMWSDTVRGALMWLGAGDPAGTMDRLRKADPVLASLTAVLLTWRDVFGSEPTTAREAIEATEYGGRRAMEAKRNGAAGRADGGRRARRKDRQPRSRLLARPSRRRPRRQYRGKPVAMEAFDQRQGFVLWRLTVEGVTVAFVAFVALFHLHAKKWQCNFSIGAGVSHESHQSHKPHHWHVLTNGGALRTSVLSGRSRSFGRSTHADHWSPSFEQVLPTEPFTAGLGYKLHLTGGHRYEQRRRVPGSKPRPAAAPKPSALKLTRDMKKGEWMDVLAAIWANPKNWRRSGQGNAYIVINDVDICIVIVRKYTVFQCERRRRDGQGADHVEINSCRDSVPSTMRGTR